MSREFIVLGSSSNTPTRKRNHNGYVLRWDNRLVLFDPGEGTQRQFTFAGVAAARLTDICVTHFHGDHCLGLPGIIQRLSGEGVTRTVPIYYPADGQEFFERLRYASDYIAITPIEPKPISADGEIGIIGTSTLTAKKLDHRITSYGYRVEEPDGRGFVRAALEAAGVTGPDVGILKAEGSFDTGERVVTLEDVTEHRPGQSFALVMDTRICDAAIELAEGVDVLVCESTFLESEAHLAQQYAHMTAAQAARVAVEAGAKNLVLTHFSARYPNSQVFVDEAKSIFENVVAVNDFDRITF
jgi:ribonuclease Z